ncbi:hypothetical protein Pmani_039326 [Petrolisthes manimaculis]|uniref:Uncharacterized protein n=1 Tax=Petrolisthes manimaculis TaxID=1843537 RepID=A0AAE1NCR0_9EUCA|nr:hypothetical protein Pmani_039326 [Petrolisthes manimaculis]
MYLGVSEVAGEFGGATIFLPSKRGQSCIFKEKLTGPLPPLAAISTSSQSDVRHPLESPQPLLESINCHAFCLRAAWKKPQGLGNDQVEHQHLLTSTPSSSITININTNTNTFSTHVIPASVHQNSQTNLNTTLTYHQHNIPTPHTNTTHQHHTPTPHTNTTHQHQHLNLQQTTPTTFTFRLPHTRSSTQEKFSSL